MIPRMRSFLAALALAALPGLAQAEDREIRGELSYRQRIALPEDALMVVEVTDADGAVLGEARSPTGGRQVPLPFQVRAPKEAALTLRGAVFVGGQPAWLSEPVAVPSGSEPADVGTLPLMPVRAMGFATRFRCGGTELELGFVGDGARLRVGGRYVDLVPEPAATGTKFADPRDPGTHVWIRGEAMTVTLAGTPLPPCHAALPEPAPLRAAGTEPGWSLVIAGESLSFTAPDGTVTTANLPEPEVRADGARRYALADHDLAVILADRICRDPATGLPHPLAVTVETAAGQLSGCGGDPAALLRGTEWRVAEVEGEALGPEAGATIGFRGARVSGSGGCNRYAGGFSLTGQGLGFGAMAVTRMACPSERMASEQRFLAALQEVDRFDLSPDGALVLIGEDRVRIVARP